MAKYYAVKVGKKTGIFDNWDECKESVNGFPGALYKSFKDISEAYAYMGWEGSQMSLFDFDSHPVDNETGSIDFSSEEESANIIFDDADESVPYSNKRHAVAYVDGSFNSSTGIFSYGVVMFYDGEEIHLSESMDDEELSSMRNVAGEIHGSMAAMKFAVEKGCRELTIYHDYEGIAKWPLGLWRTNKEGTIAYKKFYNSIRKQLNVNFVKVKGHSGDKYNDLADKLAKEAAGIS